MHVYKRFASTQSVLHYILMMYVSILLKHIYIFELYVEYGIVLPFLILHYL